MVTFSEFKEAMEANPELAAKYFDAQKALADGKTVSSKAELIVKAAAEVGYEISAEEAERAIATTQQLSEEELANVSGGANESCAITYGCKIFFMCETTYKGLEIIDKLL